MDVEGQEKQDQEHLQLLCPYSNHTNPAAKILHPTFCNLPETPLVILL